MKLLGKTSKYEKILAYMRDPDGELSTLTEHEQFTLDRWMEAYSLIRKYNSNADAAAILMKRFNISRPTAFRDVTDAISLMGDINKSTKEGCRNIALQIILDGVAIARAKNNEDGMIKGGAAYGKTAGVNTVDPDLIDWSVVEPHTYEFGLPAAYMELFKQMVSGGNVDLTEMANNDMVKIMADKAEDAIIIPEEGDE